MVEEGYTRVTMDLPDELMVMVTLLKGRCRLDKAAPFSVKSAKGFVFEAVEEKIVNILSSIPDAEVMLETVAPGLGQSYTELFNRVSHRNARLSQAPSVEESEAKESEAHDMPE